MRTSWKAQGVSYSTVGLELAVSIVIGLLGGWWLDGKLGTSPYLAIAGLGCGLFAGFRFVWRAAKRMKRDAGDDGFRESRTGRDARFSLDQKERDDRRTS